MLLLFVTVLSGAFLWAVFNIVNSYFLRDKKVPEDVMTIASSLGILASCVVAELIYDLTREELPTITGEFWFNFAIFALLNVLLIPLNVRAYKLEDASIVASLSSSMPMFVIFMSWILLQEWPTFYGRVAIGCIALGAYVLRLKGAEVQLPSVVAKVLPCRWHGNAVFLFGPWLRLFSSKGARLALLVAYLGAVAINFEKLAILASTPMIANAGCYLVVVGFIYAWSKNKKESDNWVNLDKSQFRIIFFLSFVVMGLSEILMGIGFYYGIVPYVGALKRTQILWTVILAGIILKEKNAFTRIIGALIIFIGTVLIAF